MILPPPQTMDEKSKYVEMILSEHVVLGADHLCGHLDVASFRKYGSTCLFCPRMYENAVTS